MLRKILVISVVLLVSISTSMAGLGPNMQEGKITKTKVDGNTVTWTVKCSGQGGEVTGTGKMTYSGSSFKGKIEMTMVQSNTKMISHINGHRIGDCE